MSGLKSREARLEELLRAAKEGPDRRRRDDEVRARARVRVWFGLVRCGMA